jgi:hypothetical protein
MPSSSPSSCPSLLLAEISEIKRRMKHSTRSRVKRFRRAPLPMLVRADSERCVGFSSWPNGSLSSASRRRRSIARPAALPGRNRVSRRQGFSERKRRTKHSTRYRVKRFLQVPLRVLVRAVSERCVGFSSWPYGSLKSTSRRRRRRSAVLAASLRASC